MRACPQNRLLTSDSGTAVATATSGDEDVQVSATTIGGVSVPAGSTIAIASANGGSQWTRTYTNLLGQVIVTQQSGVNDSANASPQSSTTQYDGNGRPVLSVGFDGSMTHTQYSPATGMVSATWIDANGNGVFDAGVDSKTLFDATATTTPNSSGFFGIGQTVLSAAGVQNFFSGTLGGGLVQQQDDNGQKTTTVVTPASDGSDTVFTNHPDGSRTVDTYSQGLLREEDQQDKGGYNTISSVGYGYDMLGRNTTLTDFTGTTTYTLRNDGSVSAIAYPDGRVQTVTAMDPATGVPTTVHRTDGQSVSQTIDGNGRTTSQSGAGVLPVKFDYSSLGQLSDLTTFSSGTLGTTASSDARRTHFVYDPTSGLLSAEQYGYSSGGYAYQIGYGYNTNRQLTNITRPGSNSTLFYNSAGQQTGSLAADPFTDATIADSSAPLDDQGRPQGMVETVTDASGHQVSAAANGFTYYPTGQLASESQVGGISASYSYYGPQDSGSGQEAGAIKDLSITQNNIAIGNAATYVYDDSGRLRKVIYGSTTYTYDYKPSTNLIATVTLSVGGSVVTSTSYNYESNTGRLSGVTTTAGSATLYSAGYTYNNNDQRATETVSQLSADNSTTASHGWTFGYDVRDELNSITKTSDSSAVSAFHYDGVGNETDIGSLNSVNQYTSFSYNARGDLTDDGTQTYTFDLKDRLTAVTPDSPASGSQKLSLAYDGQDRLIQKSVYGWDATLNGGAGGWSAAPSGVRQYVYDGSLLIGELDGNNNLIARYVWGQGGAAGGLALVIDLSGSSPLVYQPLCDASGNVVSLINSATGSVAATYSYDAYGNTTASGSAAGVCSLRFGGMIYLPEAKLYVSSTRVYNPTLYRWLTPDTIDYGGGYNLYAYAGDDPINNVDPTGTATEKITYDYADDSNFGNTIRPVHHWSENFNLANGVYIGGKRVITYNDNRRFYIDHLYGREEIDKAQALLQPAGTVGVVGSVDVWVQPQWQPTVDKIFAAAEEEWNALQDRLAGIQSLAGAIATVGNAINDVVLDFTPIAPVKAAYEATTGTSFVNQKQELTPLSRLLAIGLSGAALLKAVSYMAKAGKAIDAAADAAATGVQARKILAASLGAHGYPVEAEAHHIFGVALYDTPLGMKLQRWGIELNSPANGVWLPKYDYPNRIASIHRGRPTAEYTNYVINKLKMATNKDDALEIFGELKRELLTGTLKVNGAD